MHSLALVLVASLVAIIQASARHPGGSSQGSFRVREADSGLPPDHARVRLPDSVRDDLLTWCRAGYRRNDLLCYRSGC